MKCDTCDQLFPDSSVKVWNSKRVCPSCFQTLAKLPATTSESKVPARPVEPAVRIDPAAYIDTKFAPDPESFCSASTNSDLLAIVKIASDSGKRELSAGEARQWCAFLAINQKAHIARLLAEDLRMPITDSQAFTIAKNYLSGVHSASGTRMVAELCVCVPLTDEERRVAEEIGYHALKAFTTHEKNYPLTEQQLRLLSSQTVAVGENRYRKDWKSAFNGAQQMARDSVFCANARIVEASMDLTQVLVGESLQELESEIVNYCRVCETHHNL